MNRSYANRSNKAPFRYDHKQRVLVTIDNIEFDGVILGRGFKAHYNLATKRSTYDYNVKQYFIKLRGLGCPRVVDEDQVYPYPNI